MKLIGVVLGVALCLPLALSLPTAMAQSEPTVEIIGGLGLDDAAAARGPRFSACNKISGADGSDSAKHPAMLAVAQKTAAPLSTPKPAAKSAAVAAAAKPAVRKSTGSTSGWRSARVTWYGPGLYGNKTASGTILKPTDMIVAHRTLAFGTKIEFEYKGRRCVAVVADRGPHTAGLEFDLGPGTAQALGFSGKDTVKYRFVK